MENGGTNGKQWPTFYFEDLELAPNAEIEPKDAILYTYSVRSQAVDFGSEQGRSILCNRRRS